MCLDGTGNEYGEHNTSVVKLYQAIQQDPQQVAYYDTGVGTFAPSPHFSPHTCCGTRYGRVYYVALGPGARRSDDYASAPGLSRAL